MPLVYRDISKRPLDDDSKRQAVQYALRLNEKQKMDKATLAEAKRRDGISKARLRVTQSNKPVEERKALSEVQKKAN